MAAGGRVVTVFFVAGVPQQQGSKTGYVVAGRAVLTDSNKTRLKPWRAAIAEVAAATWAHHPQIVDGPVRVEATFVMPRGKTVKRPYPSVIPDLDKLIRALFDGITQAGNVWRDDAQVVQIAIDEVYGEAPGVHVDITRVS